MVCLKSGAVADTETEILFNESVGATPFHMPIGERSVETFEVNDCWYIVASASGRVEVAIVERDALINKQNCLGG